jgi:preprotein translocase subunit SecB
MAEQEQGQNAENQPQFALQRLYLKDLSFESPSSPQVFTNKWEPQVKLDVNTGAKALQDNLFEVVLTVTVTVENAGKVAYLVETKQAGIFLMKNVEDSVKKRALGTLCPNTLFPYARETVDNLSTRGGFPPLHLAPINFDALYAEAESREAEKQQAETTH